jgi:hypothetical protein
MKFTHRYNRKNPANRQRKEHESRYTRIQVMPLRENHRISLEKQVYTAVDKLRSNVNKLPVNLQIATLTLMYRVIAISIGS